MVKAKKPKRNVKKAGKWAAKYVKARPERKRPNTAIVPGIVTKRYGFSLRGMVSEPYCGRGSREAAGPKRVPSKSRPRKRPKRAPTGLPGGLIPFAACKAACGPFSADSTRRRFNRHVLVGRAGGGGPAHARPQHQERATFPATRAAVGYRLVLAGAASLPETPKLGPDVPKYGRGLSIY